MNKKTFGSFIMLLCAAIWGLAYVVQTLANASISTYTIVCMKNAGGFLLIPVAILMKQKYTKDTIKYGIILGIFMTVAMVSQQKGMELSTIGKSSFISSLYIVLVPFIAYFLGRKINKYAIIGVCIAAVGMYFLCMNGSFSLALGDIYLVICALALALQIAFIDKFVTSVDAIPLASVQCITVCVISAIPMFLFEKPEASDMISVLPHILYLAICAGALSETLQMTYQKVVEPTLASLLMSFESVFGALFGFLIMHEVLSLRELIGCALIFIAVLIAQKE